MHVSQSSDDGDEHMMKTVDTIQVDVIEASFFTEDKELLEQAGASTPPDLSHSVMPAVCAVLRHEIAGGTKITSWKKHMMFVNFSNIS